MEKEVTQKKITDDTKTQTKQNSKTVATQSGKRERHTGRGRRVVRREDRVRSEFDQKIISIRRVTRVVAGGRRFSFSVALVSGNKKGSVGVGIGKASDTALAIEKATRDAKKHMIKVQLSKELQLPHETAAKYCASNVIIMPAPSRGLAAGGSVRNVLELAGIKGVTAKILSRSKNGLNNARATIKALSKLQL